MTAAASAAGAPSLAIVQAEMAAAGLALERKYRKPEPEHRRTGSKVRRRSVMVGQERAAAPRLTRAEAEMRKRHLRGHAAKTRPKGQRRGGPGSIGWVALATFDHIVDWSVTQITGIHPSIKGIASAIGTDAATVVRALTELKRQGFLDWDRRKALTGQQGLRGPQVKQVTNFYYLPIPSAAMALITAWRRAAADKRAARVRTAFLRIVAAIPGLPTALQDRNRRAAPIDAAIAAGRERARLRSERDLS